MDVKLPNGTVIQGVPDNYTQAQVMSLAVKNNLASESDFNVSEQPEQTTTQKVYQAVKPFVAPTIEALGAAGGGLVGVPMGPAGIVGGAGLGYGMAKELLQLGDVYLGGQQQRQGEQQVVEPLKNILEGATMEAGGRVVAPLIAKGVGKVADIGSLSKIKAGQVARQSLGKDLPSVLETLKNAPAGSNIAEITAGIENPTWQALIKDVLERDPQFLRKINAFGEEESLKALSKLAGGQNAAEVRAVLESAKTALNETTGPLREAALTRANLGKEVATYEADVGKLSDEAAVQVQRVRDLIKAGDLAEASARLDLIKRGIPVGFSKFTYKGELGQLADRWATDAANASLDLGQGAKFAKAAADNLRAEGIKPLEGNKLIQKISKIAENPSFAGDDVLLGAIQNVSDDIAKWTNNGGIIDARALDAIRKNSVNAAIQKLRQGIDATSQKKLASKVLSDIKPELINAIEEAGGVGYRKYLEDYTKGMQQIAERKLSAEGLRLWKTDKDKFVNLVMNESPDAVEKILGPGRYNIAQELSSETMDILSKQAQKRLTQLSVSSQASEGQKALGEIIKNQTSLIRLPSFLNFWATAGNKTLGELEKAMGKESMNILTNAMKSTEGAKNLLETLPTVQKNKLLNFFANPEEWSKKTGMAVSNIAKQSILSLSRDNNVSSERLISNPDTTPAGLFGNTLGISP